MPYKKSKYSPTLNSELKFTALDVLSESPCAMTIEEIQRQRSSLSPQTTQKMARILNELVEMGMVRKSHSKSRGKMMYIATSQLAAQGYELKEGEIL